MIAREHPIERLTQPEFLRRVLSLMREEYHGAFVDLGLVNANGIQVAYAGPFNLLMADYSAAEWFQNAVSSESVISDVFAGLRGSPHFIVATQKKVGDELYVVKATIDFEAFNALVENLRIGSTGFAFIINREGDFQTNPHFEVALNRAPWVDLLEGRIRSDRISVLDGEDVLGRKAIFTIAPLKQGAVVSVLSARDIRCVCRTPPGAGFRSCRSDHRLVGRRSLPATSSRATSPNDLPTPTATGP